MGNRLYVSNLPSTATEEMLVTRFCRFGGVVSVMLEAVSRANRRGAVVEMRSSWDAQNAINGLNLSDFDGRLVSVYKAAAATPGKPL
jgi:RNA recognition motif-containing protein